MRFYEKYRFCPVCGQKYGASAFHKASSSFFCDGCEYRFYQNTRPSASAVIPAAHASGHVLMMTRAVEPGFGKLALPGGFLDYGEEPAQAAERETLEETSLSVRVDHFLACTMVDYVWCGLEMSVVELAFLMHPAQNPVFTVPVGEASKLEYFEIDEINEQPEKLAFAGHRQVLKTYRAELCAAGGLTASKHAYHKLR
jgi:NAD+ diphosphatase